MKISELWLREWVNPSLTIEQLAYQLTMAGLEVDSVTPVAGEFTGVIVAEVIKTQAHPEADKLTLCEVKTGDERFVQIVCGAANVRAGLKVALATVGAKLPHNIKIKEAKLRGHLSQGMLCSESELGLAESSEGIMELDEDAPIGVNLRDYLSLDDQIIDIDLTPNRSDCLSVMGVAREVAALNQLSAIKKPDSVVAPKIDDVLAIHLTHPEACPSYCGRVLRGINNHVQTPLWMRERLRRCGLRSIHPVVDVTNYVMLELGQPLHAFDLNSLEGDISIRFASDKEAIELLDGQTVHLKEDVLVIADDKKPLAIAGVMGGLSSSVVEDSQDIFIESAFFNPRMIAGVARRFGLCTDSSQRFERGVDFEIQRMAVERVTALLQEIAGGEAGPIVEVHDKHLKPAQNTLIFDLNKVKRLTGIELPFPEIISFLEVLGMETSTQSSDIIQVTIPTYRFDISLEADLVEEVIRLYGYDKLKGQSGSCSMQAGQISPLQTLESSLSHWFSHRGYHETISYSFVDPELQETLYPETQTLSLLNPISPELSQMRVGLWSGLIASMVYNAHRQQQAMKLFEQGVVFRVENKHIKEHASIAGLIMGERGGLNWSESTRPFDFYDLKGDLESLFRDLNIEQVEFIAEKHPALHSGQSAKIMIGGQHAGYIGTLNPRITDALDIQQDVILFELILSPMTKDRMPGYKSISKYPQIRRDLSFLVADEVSAEDIKQVICGTVSQDWLKAYDVFDVYKGQGVPEGKKSLGIALTLQDTNRTLIDTEINDLISAILTKLDDKFAIILRE